MPSPKKHIETANSADPRRKMFCDFILCQLSPVVISILSTRRTKCPLDRSNIITYERTILARRHPRCTISQRGPVAKPTMDIDSPLKTEADLQNQRRI